MTREDLRTPASLSLPPSARAAAYLQAVMFRHVLSLRASGCRKPAEEGFLTAESDGVAVWSGIRDKEELEAWLALLPRPWCTQIRTRLAARAAQANVGWQVIVCMEVNGTHMPPAVLSVVA